MNDIQLGKLIYAITGDSTELENALKKAKKEMSAFQKALSAVAGFFAFQKIVQGIKFIIDATSGLNESQNALNKVFKESSSVIENYGKTANKSVGLSKRAFNELATVTGAQFKNAGIATDRAAKQTIELTKRAADLASVFNTDVKDALGAANAALRGEGEAIRRYAINVSEAAVQQEALASGLITSKDQMNEAIKVQARYQLILKQSSDAQGDFSDTSDQFANSLRIAQANIENLASKVGSSALPVLSSLIGGFNFAAEAIGNFIDESEKESEVLNKNNIELQSRLEVLKDNNISEALRARITKNVNEQLKELNLNQIDANTSVEELNKLQQKSNEIFLEKIRIASAQELIAEQEKKANKLQKKNFDDLKELEFLKIQIASKDIQVSVRQKLDAQKRVDFLQAEIDKRNEALNKINEEIQGIIKRSGATEKDNETNEAAKELEKERLRLLKEKQALDAKDKAEKEKDFSDKLRESLTLLQSQDKVAKELGTDFDLAAQQKDLLFGALAQADAEGFSKSIDMIRKKIKELGLDIGETFEDKFNRIAGQVEEVAQRILGVLSSIDSYREASTESEISRIDRETQAKLEAAGLQENTEIEKLQKELDAAIAKGDQQTANELEQDIARQKIIEEGEKKKAKIKYKADLAGWKSSILQVGIEAALAQLRAVSAGLSSKIPPVFIPLYSGLAAVASGLALAGTIKSKPQPQGFQDGGFVPGNSFAGDKVPIQVNSGEAVLNPNQQKNFLDIANNGVAGGQIIVQLVAQTGRELKKWIFDGTRDGSIKIDDSSLISVGF